MDEVAHNNRLVNELSPDSCSCGGVIAQAREYWEKVLLTREDTGGIVLAWGDEALIYQLVQMITPREGFGNLLAEIVVLGVG